jgi:cyclophilin family peptidyl-prolyl cis-trans isomerase
MRYALSACLSGVLVLTGCQSTKAPTQDAPLTSATVLASAQAEDWRRPDPENLLCLDFAKGRVVIELLPVLAPRHVANVKAMVREGYFDGLAIVRVQDNYVVQWGDPNAEDKAKAKPIRTAQHHLPAELEFRLPASTVFHWWRGEHYIQVGCSLARCLAAPPPARAPRDWVQMAGDWRRRTAAAVAIRVLSRA